MGYGAYKNEAPPFLDGGHVADADTVACWPLFNRTAAMRTSTVSGPPTFTDGGGLVWVPTPYTGKSGAIGVNRSYGLALPTYYANVNPIVNRPLTFACLIFPSSNATGTFRDFMRHEIQSGGNPSFRWGINGSGNIWVGRETPAWENQPSTLAPVENTWSHVVAVFESGNNVRVYLNGSSSGETLTFVGGYEAEYTGARLSVGHGFTGGSNIAVCSVIVKNIDPTDSQIDAMFAECPLP